jgi:hypothetical protein
LIHKISRIKSNFFLEHCDHIQVVTACTMSKFLKHILPTMREKPPISFMTKLKKLEAEGAYSDKVESIRFEFLVDPSNPATRFSKEFFVFKDGSPEEYIRWLMSYCDLELLMPLNEPSDRTKMLRTM